jgi:cytochrome P450
MTIDYDPFSHAAMQDPTPVYAALRRQGEPYFIEQYNAWALTKFEDVWTVSVNHESDMTFTRGVTPGQVLLDDPVPHAFTTMDGRDHRRWRGLVRDTYTPPAVKAETERFRALTREVLEPLLSQGRLDVYQDLANRIFCLNSGYNLGLPKEDAITWRKLIDEMLHRDIGQKGGGSERNQMAAGELYGYLADYVARIRKNPDLASGHTATYMSAEIDGVKLDDEALTHLLFNFLVVGSETTPMVCGGTIYYLAKHPEQKKAVLADRSLIKNAFLETCRYDQPTNMLCRRVTKSFELSGNQIREGQNLLLIYASANRDEEVFENPDAYDIYRENKRNLSFGIGGHVCLGMHLAVMGGIVILEELLDAVGDYELLEDECERAYGEHLSGFIKVPIQFQR